ncbi:alpha/beta hydrolase family protein [Terrarubrum flagellatum]|uniref:alpha/beta hydrolase family protein n=1 Tax=Terrirubrum flagellatum TaxID=2895980 RepID=UPI003144D976
MSTATTRATASPGLPQAIVEDVSFDTKDGRTLIGRLYRPEEAPRLAVVIHGGAGFPARFYRDFASWFATTYGAAVLTYDYRDFGWSLAGPLAKSSARISDWAIADQSAALSWLVSRFPDLPPRVVGHSLGGQWLAFHDEVARIDRVAAVASGPAFWLEHPWSYMPQVIAFWWLLGPVATRFAGYMPGRLLGLGADIPANVYWEWRRLCLTRGYHRAEWGRAYPTPKLDAALFDLTIVPIVDDVLITPAMVRKLPGFYPHARVREALIDPAALGLKKVGHGGAFLARNKACWPLIAEPLLD